MHILAGTSQAKVRVMNNAAGKSVKEAYPGTAVIVSGWKTLPGAGDSVLSASEGDIKKALTNRLRKVEEEAQLADIEAINEKRREERERVEEEERALANTRRPINSRAPTIEIEGQSDVNELRLVIKGDVSGSVEAVEDALKIIGNSAARVKVVSRGVGEVSESDVMLAKTAGGEHLSVPFADAHFSR
jgi:translation initiation factor IF-2